MSARYYDFLSSSYFTFFSKTFGRVLFCVAVVLSPLNRTLHTAKAFLMNIIKNVSKCWGYYVANFSAETHNVGC